MADQERVQATIKQLVRDWSVEGTEERTACYQPIIDEILHQFPLEHWYDTLFLFKHLHLYNDAIVKKTQKTMGGIYKRIKKF